MRLLAIALLIVLSSVSQKQNQKAPCANTTTETDHHGTKDAPLVVSVTPTPKTDEEITQEKKNRDRETENNRYALINDGVLALIGLLQLGVFGYQAYKLKQTVESAGEESKAMERHIEEAARSASAMEGIGKVIQAGNKAILRAYLTTVIGDPIYQERRVGQPDLKFEARPHLANTGNTPARKVRIRIKADILPQPIPNDFGFPLPAEDDANVGDATVAAHQTYVMGGVVEYFVPDSEVASIKEGVGKCLYVWGLITYEDIFGDVHTTKFGQQITWLPNGKVFGYYIPGQNDMT